MAINGGVVGPCCVAVLTFITTYFMMRRTCGVKRSFSLPIVRESSQSNHALEIPLLEAVPLCSCFFMSLAALVLYLIVQKKRVAIEPGISACVPAGPNLPLLEHLANSSVYLVLLTCPTECRKSPRNSLQHGRATSTVVPLRRLQ